MSHTSIQDYLITQRPRYQRRTTKAARSKLLSEICEVTAMDRKHLIKILCGRRPIRGQTAAALGEQRGRPSKYTLILPVIKGLWLASEQPCGKRLRSVLDCWRPHWEAEHGLLSATHRALLKAISPAQIDRLLAPARTNSMPASQRRGATLAAIKARIPVRTGPWEVSGPGWTEMDTVAHCGGSMRGSFWWTLVQTDIWSGWTEQQPTWNKGQEAVRSAAVDLEAALPFPLLGVDTDNGSEFLNWHLLEWWEQHDPVITLTRSRPYRKNDNAHVEQKNRTHVRELLGEERLDVCAQAQALIELHRLWSQFHNYFLPTLKLTSKERVGKRVKKHYEPVARTPCQRLLDGGGLSHKACIALRAKRASLNPFRLQERVELLLGVIWSQQNPAEPATEEQKA